MKWLLGVLLTIFLFGCGPGFKANPGNPDNPVPGFSAISRGTAFIPISVGSGNSMNATQPMFVTVSQNVTFTVDNSNFSTPLNVTGDTLDFGSIEITDLRDNKLKVCGTGGNQKCTQAYLIVYTTGTAGAGLYNSTDGYGLPITSELNGSGSSVGLEQANAAIMQQFTIPANQNVVRLSDFNLTPIYDILVDSSNAGVGSYSTTLVIEYALSQ